ncbi:MAG: PIG-L family deacetylase [Ornithinimicrobium sp.]
MALTVVSFHAHPDDEALLTGGTLAKLASHGHRVVLVTATDGAAGLTSTETHALGDLGQIRLHELERSAAALGAHRVVSLDYTDGAFSGVPVPVAAERLAAVLREEKADVLTGYDRAGGYGHPDHVHVHHVAREAARVARTPVLLEATIDRRRLLRAVRLLSVLPIPLAVDPRDFKTAYSDPNEITHRVDVRHQIPAKKAALAAHHSQTLGAQQRTVGLLLSLPAPLLRPVLGLEWFIEVGRNRSPRIAAALGERPPRPPKRDR